MEAETLVQSDWTMDGNGLPFQKSLYLRAFGFTGDTHGAEDLVQETYMKAFRHYGQFKKGTNLRAWLFKILKNSFINHYRRKTIESIRTRGAGRDLETMPSEPLLPGASLPGEPSTVELDDEIREAMASLPEQYRTAVILKDLDQFSYKEIARLVGVPVGTVMSRLYRGRKMLESALMSYGKRQGYLRSPEAIKRRDGFVRAS